MYKPIQKVDVEELKKLKMTDDVSIVYDYLDDLFEKWITTDIIKLNGNLQEGFIKFPLVYVVKLKEEFYYSFYVRKTKSFFTKTLGFWGFFKNSVNIVNEYSFFYGMCNASRVQTINEYLTKNQNKIEEIVKNYKPKNIPDGMNYVLRGKKDSEQEIYILELSW
jgi:hypothetical protein